MNTISRTILLLAITAIAAPALAGSMTPPHIRQRHDDHTNYFYTKRKRAGHLFQGRYKAILIEADEYLMELSRYIHLNPVRAGMTVKPEDHSWSSYNDYTRGKVKAALAPY